VELRELDKLFAALPAAQRDGLSLVALGGNSYEAAARKAGCAVGTMKSRISRDRAALASAMEAAPEDAVANKKNAFSLQYLEHLESAAQPSRMPDSPLRSGCHVHRDQLARNGGPICTVSAQFSLLLDRASCRQGNALRTTVQIHACQGAAERGFAMMPA
jgi:hypothetical protein